MVLTSFGRLFFLFIICCFSYVAKHINFFRWRRLKNTKTYTSGVNNFKRTSELITFFFNLLLSENCFDCENL